MIRFSNHWKIWLVLFPIIGTCYATAPGGLHGFFQAWWGGTPVGDPYESLSPTAYWYPSKDLNNTDRIGGIASTNTVNAASATTNGWEFNGTSQYLDMGRPVSIEIGTNTKYSMVVWIKHATGNMGATSGIMGKSFAAGGDRWAILGYDNSGDRMYSVVASDGTFLVLDIPTTVNSNVWYQAALVIDRPTSNGIKLYFDGVQIGQGTLNDTNAITFDGNINVPFRFGSYNNASGSPASYWNGQMDRAAIWNGRALTSNEVFNLFENTKSGRK